MLAIILVFIICVYAAPMNLGRIFNAGLIASTFKPSHSFHIMMNYNSKSLHATVNQEDHQGSIPLTSTSRLEPFTRELQLTPLFMNQENSIVEKDSTTIDPLIPKYQPSIPDSKEKRKKETFSNENSENHLHLNIPDHSLRNRVRYSDIENGFKTFDFLERFPYGSHGGPLKDIYRRLGYDLSWNLGTKSPRWVSETLTRKTLNYHKHRTRPRLFDDQQIGALEESYDYKFIGPWSRGHLACSANHRNTEAEFNETFLASNFIRICI